MHELSGWLLLIFASIAASILAQFFPKISENYVSMAVGAIIASIPFFNNMIPEFEPEVFMITIIAPLLFFEGQAMNLNRVGHKLKTILEIVVVLVVISTVVTGFALSYITGIGLSLALVMAAISTPTDATATESVSEGLQLPKGEKNMLKMEALFNDASGIILLNATVLFLLRGEIDYGSTIINFLFAAIGGALFGAIIAFIAIFFRQALIRLPFDNAVNAQIMLAVALPFIIYVLAEEIHVSGIIAVVCAGLLHNSEAQRSRFSDMHQFYLGNNIFSLVQELLNNAVFLILGLNFVRIIMDEDVTFSSWIWITAGIVLYAMNLLVRYLYVLLIMKRGHHSALIFSLGGVHGAVTLALVFMAASLGLSSNQFNLVIMSESVMIILSMLVPSIVFWFILPKEEHDTGEKKKYRQEMVNRAISEVEQMYLPEKVRQSVIYDLRDQNSETSLRQFWQQWFYVSRRPAFNKVERSLEQQALLWSFYIEREYLAGLLEEGEVDSTDLYDLYNEVALAEAMVLDPKSSFH